MSAPTQRGRRAPPRPAPQAVAPQAQTDLVLLGEFGRPHGLRGELRLKSFTADPLAIGEYRPLSTRTGQAITLDAVRAASGAAADILVVRVAGVHDRAGAEALVRIGLYCPRERLGAPDDADEVFTADLIGAAAMDADGALVGHVVAVPNYGGGDLLEIRSVAGGPTALLPFTKAFVPALDLPARRLTIAPPADLFDPPGPKPDDAPA